MVIDEAEDNELELEILSSVERARDSLSPEQLLLLAIVKQTERDLFSHEERVREEARNWFLAKDKSHIFRFSVICEYLNVNPKYLRRYARHSNATQRAA